MYHCQSRGCPLGRLRYGESPGGAEAGRRSDYTCANRSIGPPARRCLPDASFARRADGSHLRDCPPPSILKRGPSGTHLSVPLDFQLQVFCVGVKARGPARSGVRVGTERGVGAPASGTRKAGGSARAVRCYRPNPWSLASRAARIATRPRERAQERPHGQSGVAVTGTWRRHPARQWRRQSR